ncbi:MAG: hypothetical protein ROO71_08905 [Balneola sp.]
MSSVQADWFEIKKALDRAPHGSGDQVMQRFVNRLGVSKHTIYREIRSRYGKAKEIEREVQVDPDNELIEMIFNMKIMGELMHLKRREISTENCIQILIDRGIKGADQLTVSTVNRRLREMQFRDKQPNKRIESRYANQVHMIDFSRSKYFQIFDYDARKDDYMLTVSGKELHYKDENNDRFRTWIVQYMDDFSRLRKVKCYAEMNESALLGLEHLRWSWLADEEDEHLLKYLPIEMFRSDNGAFRKAQETINAMDVMGIKLTKQMPGRKGGTAKVENRMKSLWQEFELPLALNLGQGSRIWLSEYNELVHEFTLKEHNKQHPVFKDFTKGEWYQRSLADRSQVQRTTKVDVIRVATRVETRKVDDHLRISLNNVFYEVPQYVEGLPTINQEIQIFTNKYGEYNAKFKGDPDSPVFELRVWEPSYWGEMESFAHTERRKAEDRLEADPRNVSEILEGIDEGEGQVGNESEEISLPAPQSKKPTYMSPLVDDVTADESTFKKKVEKKGKVYRSELDARAFVGRQIQAYGLTYGEVSTYFDGVMKGSIIYENDLLDIVKQIYDDFDNGLLASNY